MPKEAKLPNNQKLCVLCEVAWRERQSKYCRDCQRASFLYRQYGTGQIAAISAVKREVKEGRLPPASEFLCVDCEAPASDYDHRDYNKPLEVQPVCRPCNAKRGYAIPKRMTFAEFLAAMQGTHHLSGQWPIPLEAFEPIRRKYWPNEQQQEKTSE